MQHSAGTKIKNLQVLLWKKELEKEELNREFNAIQSRRDKLNNQIQKDGFSIKVVDGVVVTVLDN